MKVHATKVISSQLNSIKFIFKPIVRYDYKLLVELTRESGIY